MIFPLSVPATAGTANTAGTAGATSAMPARPVQTLINAALARGEKRIVLPPGEYRESAIIRLNDLSGITLDGTGATVIFTNYKNGGIYATGCDALTLIGLTIDFDPLPFTQGTIDELDVNEGRILVTLHDGYPDLNADTLNGNAHAFSPDTHLWKTGTPDLHASLEARALTPRRALLRFSAANRWRIATLSPGDHLVFPFRQGHGMSLVRCRDTTVRNLTILTAPGTGILSRFADGQNRFSYTIRRGPPPSPPARPGARSVATIPRLFSTCADGFNYAYARTGPVLENCDFAFMGDDSVNLHGVAFSVAAVSDGGREIRILRPYSREHFDAVIRPHDKARALAKGNFDIRGAAPVESFEYEPAPAPGSGSGTPLPSGNKAGEKPHSTYRLRLATPLPVDPGDLIDIPAIAAPGYTIKNSHFHDHRARALRLMAPDGLVENNVIEGIKQAAITLGPEYAYWREAGWVHDVTVRGNTIRRTGFDPGQRQPDAFTPGAIGTLYRPEQPGLPHPLARHENIRIEQNTIEDVAGPAIHINQADNVHITGNRWQRTNLAPPPPAAAKSRYGLTAGGPLCIDASTHVTIDQPAPPAPPAAFRTLKVDPRDPAAFSTLAQAAAAVRPGDTIWLAPGSGPWREPLHISTSGTAARPITIEGNGNEITGFDPLTDFIRMDDGRHEARIATPYPFVLRRNGTKRIREDATTRRFEAGIRYEPATRILSLPPDLSPEGWEISVRAFAVRIANASHHRYRNIIATGSRNDGFNLHENGTDLVFENITGSYNLDEGFSAHEQIRSTINGGHFFENDNGIYNIGQSFTRLADVEIHDNPGIGFALTDATAEATRLNIRNNGMVQLKLERGARLSGSAIRVYHNLHQTRRWLTHMESAQRHAPVTLDLKRADNPVIPGLEELPQPSSSMLSP
jgi:hypothetical protein